MKWTSFNLGICSDSDALFSVEHLGILRGYGVFETMRTYRQSLFRLDDHLDRLFSSANKIKLSSPWTRTQIVDGINDLLHGSDTSFEKRIRILLIGQDLVIQVSNLEEKPSHYYDQGIRLTSYLGVRPIPEAKIVGCLTCYLANEHAKNNGAYDSLLINPYNQQVTEGSYSNFFWVKGGQLFTTDKNILKGVTRKTVIELAKDCEFKSITLPELKQADEVFITQTSSRILPVHQLDDTSFQLGGFTQKLMKSFNEKVF